MIREIYQVPTWAIPEVYGGLSRETSEAATTEHWDYPRTVNVFLAQLHDTRGLEREMVAMRIRYLIYRNPQWLIDKLLDAVGVEPWEGLNWRDRYQHLLDAEKRAQGGG